MNVDLPQPDGPISAVIWLVRQREIDVRDGPVVAVEDGDVADVEDRLAAPVGRLRRDPRAAPLAARGRGAPCSARCVALDLGHVVAHHFCSYRLRSQMATEFIEQQDHHQHDDRAGRARRRTPDWGPASRRRSGSAAP